MEAARALPSAEADTSRAEIIAFPGATVSVREAAVTLGVSASALRQILRRAGRQQGSLTFVELEYHGMALAGRRAAPQRPWKLQMTPLSGYEITRARVAAVDERIAELRIAMLPIAQERALDHTPDRPWWRFWGRR